MANRYVSPWMNDDDERGAGDDQALPSDAWVRAEVAFAWIAFGSRSGAADVLGEVWDTLLANDDPDVLSGLPEYSDLQDDHAAFNTLREKLSAMEKVCDWAVSNCRSENLRAYLQLADRIEKVLIDSFDFVNGMTIHPLRGTLTRGGDVNMEDYFKLKSARTGQVWFKRAELIDARKSSSASLSTSASTARLAPLSRRGVGRPPAHNTSLEVFSKRRKAGEPLPKKQIDEAVAIVAQWPAGNPPRAKTVSQHIASEWRAHKSGDKL